MSETMRPDIVNLATNPSLENVSGPSGDFLVNLSPNPSFEASASGPDTSSSSMSRAMTAYAPMVAGGDSALSLTVTATPSVDTYYLQSANVEGISGVAGFACHLRWSTGSRYARLRILYRDTTGADLPGTEYSEYLRGVNNTTGGERHQLTAPIPAGAVTMLCIVYFYDDEERGIPVEGSTWSTDLWHIATADGEIELAYSLSRYFDGATNPSPDHETYWKGDPHLSPSAMRGWSTPNVGNGNYTLALATMSTDCPFTGDRFVRSYSKGRNYRAATPYYRDTAINGGPCTYSGAIYLRSSQRSEYRLSLAARDSSANVATAYTEPIRMPAGRWVRHEFHDFVVPSAHSYLQIWPQAFTDEDAMPAGATLDMDAVMIVRDQPLPAEYFDGDTQRRHVDQGWYLHEWDGEPRASSSRASWSVVDKWTRDWWENLPNAYQMIDAGMNPELGGYPLLRWMDGIGRVAGTIRQISDDLYLGRYTDPAKAPDHSLRWLALLLGMSEKQRRQPLDLLRRRMKALTTVGRSAVGSRAMIAESAKAFLIDGAQARVEPSTKKPHTLILYVRAYEVPGGDVPGLAAKVRGEGFLPAGHALEIVEVISTWDAWEAAAGKTWAEKERNIRTWNESDSAGVILE